MPFTAIPNEKTTPDVILMLEKLDKRLNDMDGKLSSKALANKVKSYNDKPWY